MGRMYWKGQKTVILRAHYLVLLLERVVLYKRLGGTSTQGKVGYLDGRVFFG